MHLVILPLSPDFATLALNISYNSIDFVTFVSPDPTYNTTTLNTKKKKPSLSPHYLTGLLAVLVLNLYYL